MSVTHGVIYWSELMTRDTKMACDYYAANCGWTYDVMQMDGGSDYYVAKVGDTPVAGIMDISAMTELDQRPAHWFTYIAVDDVDAAVTATLSAGGGLMRPAFNVPGIGRIAIIQDPTGAELGLMTPAG